MSFKQFPAVFISLLLLYSVQVKGQFNRAITVSTAEQLDSICRWATDSVNVVLKPGDYHLKPKKDVDSLIESENGSAVYVPMTYGLKISARFVHIKGAPAYGSAIYTHAGYGLYFLNCKSVVLEGVIITGGERDSDSRATDAAIVAVNSKMRIVDNLVFENIGDTGLIRKSIAGVMGICVRNGSYAFIYNNQIARNSWHGIAVLKDATATITGNVIDGVDKTTGEDVGGGRGVAIYLTRNAKATIETNVVKRYWKGIGIFVNATALVSDNLIEDIVTWGINVWDADTGRPIARIERNVIFKTGACGVAIIRYLEGSESGYFRNNIMVETAQDRRFDAPDMYCFQCALAVHGRPDNFEIADNVFYKNFWIAPCFTSLDLPASQFYEVLQTRFSTLPLQWYAGYSEFIQRFYTYLSPKP